MREDTAFARHTAPGVILTLDMVQDGGSLCQRDEEVKVLCARRTFCLAPPPASGWLRFTSEVESRHSTFPRDARALGSTGASPILPTRSRCPRQSTGFQGIAARPEMNACVRIAFSQCLLWSGVCRIPHRHQSADSDHYSTRHRPPFSHLYQLRDLVGRCC